MNRCKNCDGKSTLELSSGEAFCNSCFIRRIEKRVRKTMRTMYPLKRGDIIYIEDKNSLNNMICHDLLHAIFKKTITFTNDPEEATKKARPSTIDIEGAELIESFCKGFKYDNKDDIYPLIAILDEELEVFGKIKNIKSKRLKKQSDHKSMIDNIEKEYPGTKHSLAKTIEKLEAIKNQKKA